MSTCTSTANLNDILNNLNLSDVNLDDLQDFCENYSNSNTEAPNEFLACQLLNLLQCYGMQFMKLVLFLIFLYAWNNQMTNCYFMNSNCQLTNAISDLLNQCLENNCSGKNK